MPETEGLRLEALLEYVSRMNATDLHLSVGSVPLIRYNSQLRAVEGYEPLKPEDTQSLVESCVNEMRFEVLHEKGEVDFSFSLPGYGRFRANIFRQRGSYSLSIRSLPFTIPSAEKLGIPATVRALADKKSGLVLATGPTGSGKSTTLASLIDSINAKRRCHIITIEDPIEYLHKHKMSLVNQREVGWDTRSFATALRAALREDPDVILVGEMRDPETIDVALTAAETGHLVLSTLHTQGAAKTVNRIFDAFPHDQQQQVRAQLAAVLEGVVSQQLVPGEDQTLALACEVMIVNPAIRNLIREGKPYQINTILQTGGNEGQQTMDSSLAALYMSKRITYEDALNRAHDAQTFIQLCSRRRS
jgi:twitching motility protein PilT